MPRITPKTKTKSHTRTSKKSISVLEAISFAAIVSGIIYFESRRRRGEAVQKAGGVEVWTRDLSKEKVQNNDFDVYNAKIQKNNIFKEDAGTVALITFNEHYEIIESSSDGNCMYHSILKGLHVQGLIKDMTEMNLKRIAYGELCESKHFIKLDDVDVFIPDDPKTQKTPEESRAHYCQQMLSSIVDPKQQFWGDYIVLAALSKVMNIIFKIAEIAEKNESVIRWYTIDPNTGDNPIVFLYHSKRIHYNAIVPK